MNTKLSEFHSNRQRGGIGFSLILILILVSCAAPPSPPTPVVDITSLPSQVEEVESRPTILATMPPGAEELLSPESTATLAQPVLNCIAPAEVTPPLTEGPFYTPDSPQRTNLVEEGIPGEKIVIRGYVLDRNCQPISTAWLDFWQADANGVYDNRGYVLRGHQFTDEYGRFVLETVLPGEYPGRTPHIHVKVQPPGGSIITTQLFFPGAAANQIDRIFDQRLLVELQTTADGYEGNFNFIVP